ncbi:hypothetical protein GF386_01940 [Candidatus Pacearchaeota archaeon]|nr:hypothetical protein [Candidatus Pacearchaeota archaeon]MBD3282935.1 hypothetical protein [Candidatus Pacearchaeota archaeon]
MKRIKNSLVGAGLVSLAFAGLLALNELGVYTGFIPENESIIRNYTSTGDGRSCSSRKESEKPIILENVCEIPDLCEGNIVGQDRDTYLVDVNGNEIPDYTITKLLDYQVSK